MANHANQSSGIDTLYCDSCYIRVQGGYFECLACQDFGYCPRCFQNAERIHPGHDFKPIGPTESDDPSDGIPSESESAKSFSQRCTSCESLSVLLPSLSIIYEEVQENLRQEFESSLTKGIEDDTGPDNAELRESIAKDLYRHLHDLGTPLPIDFDHFKKLPWDRITRSYEKEFGPKEKKQEDNEEKQSDAAMLGIGLAEAMRDSLGSYVPVTALEYEVENEKKSQKKPDQHSPLSVGVKWKVRVSKLVEATQQGCIFCCFFLYKLFSPLLIGRFVGWYGQYESFTWYTNPEKNAKQRQSLISDSMKALTQLKYDRFEFGVLPVCSKKDAKLPDINKLYFRLEAAADDREVLGELFKHRGNFHGPGEKPFPLMLFNVDVYTTRDNPSATLISSFTPNPSPGSDEALDLVKQWVNECNEKHEGVCCKSPDFMAPLPRRVIDVGDGHSLRLYERSSGERGCYTTLSYCWGGSQRFQTSTYTVDAMRSGFVVTDLPKTMQDAVAITKAIGVRYIWIDCLCIIQDIPTDLSYEFSQMANIYKGSYLTICATRAENVDNGFLLNEADESTGLWKGLVPLTFWVPDQKAKTSKELAESPAQEGKVWLLDEDKSWKSIWSFATSRRGWCLQEQLLSPRFLSYGRWPTWRCRKATWTDGGYYHSPSNMRDDTETLENLLVDMIFDETSQPDDCSPVLDVFRTTQLYQAWYALVHDYSRREIGLPCDKLPAIGGMAAEFSRLTGHRYLAGLWDKNILHDLMWFTKAREWSQRPVEWRAPSWSWASVNAVITYGRITADSKPLSTVRKCNVSPKDPLSIFGEIVDGVIEVKGPFSLVELQDSNTTLEEQSKAPIRPKIDVDGDGDWFLKMMRHSVDASGTNEVNPETHKVPDAPKLEGQVYALITFSRDWTVETKGRRVKDVCYSGLFLKKSDKIPGYFERVGMFANEATEWLDQNPRPWKEEIIQII